MPRENSFSDSDGRSLTPDLSDAEDLDIPPPSPLARRNRIPSPTPPIAMTSALEPVQSRVAASLSPSARAQEPMRPLHHPKERFRSAVRKVIAMRRSTTILISRGVGGEPGIDPRRASADAQFGKIRADCEIELVDYSTLRHDYGKMTNREFVDFLADPNASKRDNWVKVRWINIAGKSWDVLKAVSLKYDIHPLALEDVFHARPGMRSKADYYPKHLFLRLLCHERGDGNNTPARKYTAAMGSTLANTSDCHLPRSSSPEPFLEDEKLPGDDMTLLEASQPNSRKSTTPLQRYKSKALGDLEQGRSHSKLSFMQTNTRAQIKEDDVRIRALKKGEQVRVKETPIFILLYRDGTVITLLPEASDLHITEPLHKRLQQRDTGLRTSSDPSLLVQALLDVVVDKAMVLIDEFHAKLKRFESQILLRPEVSTVRNLHIFSEDLILLKRTLEPIKTLIYGLRRYDVDRCAALIDPSKVPDNFRVEGFMSHKSKIYLADVFDHMEYVLSSVEMFAAIGENLINYTFNMTSYEMNEVMRVFTQVTVICLPLTLLTGYFGMNFDPMWSVHNNSDLLFWKIAIPLLAVVIPIFLFSDIKKVWRYINKRMLTRRAVKDYKTA